DRDSSCIGLPLARARRQPRWLGDVRAFLAGDDEHIDVATAADRLVAQRWRNAAAPAAAARLAANDLADVAPPRERQQFGRDTLPAEVRGFGAKARGELARLPHAVPRTP